MLKHEPMQAIYGNRDLSQHEKHLLLYLLWRMNEMNRACFPSEKCILEDTGMHRGTFFSTKNALREKGILSWTRINRTGPCHYTIDIPKCAQSQPPEQHEHPCMFSPPQQQVRHDSPTGEQSNVQQVDTIVQQVNIDRSTGEQSNVQQMDTNVQQVNTNVQQVDTNVQQVDIDRSTGEQSNVQQVDTNNKSLTQREQIFIKPSVTEVRSYVQEMNYSVDAERFVAYYESKGWLIGTTPMKNWKAALLTWHKNGQESQHSQPKLSPKVLREYTPNLGI